MLYKTSNQTALKHVSICQPVSVDIPLVYFTQQPYRNCIFQNVSNRSINIYRGHLNCKIMRCQMFLEAMSA